MSNFPALKDASGKLDAKRDELAAIFAEADPGSDGTIDLSKVARFSGDQGAAVDTIKALNDEMSDLGAQVERLTAVSAAASAMGETGRVEAGSNDGGDRRPKGLGELFTSSAAYTARAGSTGPKASLDISLRDAMSPRNTLMTTGAGWAPETTRSGLVVEDAQRPVQVTDLIPFVPWTQSAYTYMEETTFTNNAAETAEGGAFGEAALALTEKTSAVRKLAVWLPVTDEQLEDVPGARAYAEMRLSFMLRQRLDSQILVGNGTPPNLEGINAVSGIQTQAKGGDPVPDAVYKAMTLVKVTGRANPQAVVFHPNDWQGVRLLRTTDGVYIWGSPSEVGPQRIWGINVVESDAQTENTALLGDFTNYSLLAVRRGIDVQVTNSHASDFVSGKQAIRADMRAALVVTRPAAFATITGI
jgi:HK97 family phage major capsid protein